MERDNIGLAGGGPDPANHLRQHVGAIQQVQQHYIRSGTLDSIEERRRVIHARLFVHHAHRQLLETGMHLLPQLAG